ncbi:MAG: TAXI family TRAP transporter solute-binding subunit [Spirochaetia bacterium]|jgi:TRAP transporter TAXI family solute receptor|nr:TAXI family TRAP transporter solute-binding subunit [Spirochaetia bacterium]
MRRILALAIVALTAVMGLSAGGGNESSAAASGGPKPVSLVFSTQGLGTNMNSQANAIIAAAMKTLPPGSKIDVETTSPGAVSAAFTVEEGLADLTMACGAAAYWASHDGLLGRPVTKKVRGIAGGFDEPVSIIVLTDAFVKRTGIKTLEEAVGKKYPFHFATKAVGSLGEMTAKTVLGAYGASYEDIKSWGGSVTLVDSANVIAMLKDGKADISVDHTTTAQPNWVELGMTTPIHITTPPDAILKKLKAQGYAETLLPKGSYNNNVKADMPTVGSGNNLLISADVDDNTVYLITKAICENKDLLVSMFATFSVFDPATAWDVGKVGAPLHPGAEKYYREKGYLK